MDATQILLFSVVIILTLVLLVVGAQVFFILKEAKKAIKKTNELLQDAGDMLPTVKKPFLSAANLLDTVKSVKQVVDMVAHNKSVLSKKNIKHLVEDTVDNTEVVITTRRKASSATRPRYFKRGSRPLAS
jgi:uncharacterized protein YoxC